MPSDKEWLDSAKALLDRIDKRDKATADAVRDEIKHLESKVSGKPEADKPAGETASA